MLFQFNTYSSLLLPAFIQGLLFVFILFRRGQQDNRLADKLLAAILLIYTLQVTQWMFGFAGWYDAHDWHTTFMFYLKFSHWLAIGPLFYFYFLTITNSQFRWQRKYWWHFLPEGIWLLRAFFIFFFDVVIDHWLRDQSFLYFYGTHGEWLESGWGTFDSIWPYVEHISVIVYSFLTLRLYRQYQYYILENFSDTGSIHFQWLRNVLLAFIIGYVVWIGFDLLDTFTERGMSYAEDWYSFFFLGILIYYLSLAGFAYGADERPQLKLHFAPNEPQPITSPDEPEKELAEWKSKIEAIMLSEKPYLHSDLSLSQMAAILHISPPALSRAINAGFQQNFNEFINDYRVQEVKKKLGDPAFSHLTLLGVALDSGFSSKATFNRVFKNSTGISPSDYLKKISA